MRIPGNRTVRFIGSTGKVTERVALSIGAVLRSMVEAAANLSEQIGSVGAEVKKTEGSGD